MLKKSLLPLASLLGVTLGGCATVSTGRQAESNGRGISYHLPQGLLRVTVTDAEGTISVLVAGPVMVADPSHRLSTVIHRGTISDDDVTIGVDAKTNLLSSVAVTSEGRLDDILESAVRTAVALQGSNTEGGRVVFEGLYRVDQLTQAETDANRALREHFADLCTPMPAAVAAGGTETAAQRRCRELERAGARSGNPVSIAMDQAPPVLRAGDTVDLRPCQRGVCYRPLVPARVSLTFGRSRQTQPMLFPDETQIIAINLLSGVFAQQKYELKFTDGVLTSYMQNSRSELVGLVSLPLTIVKAVISAPGQLLGARQTAAASEQSYLAAIASLAQQRASLRATCAAQPQDCPESALRIIRASTSGGSSGAGNGGVFDNR